MNYDHVVVAGSVAYDEIMDFPGRFVDYLDKKKLHQINVSFVVDRLEKQLGGIATNISYNLRLLTEIKLSVVSAIGKDGDNFIDFFKKNRIETSMIVTDKKKYTAVGKVITDKADNQIWGYYYGPLDQAAKIDFKTGSYSNILYILSATAKKAFLSHQIKLIAQKSPYLYDPGMTLTWINRNELKEGVMHCQWLVGNDYEVAQILKKINVEKTLLLEKGIAIITTLGQRGVLYESASETIAIPAFTVKRIIDPTGAGDAFRGGFVAGIVENKTIRQSLIQANALASFAVESYGTVNHRPEKRMIAERIERIELSL